VLEELGRAGGTDGGQHEVRAASEVELRAVYEHDDFSVSVGNDTALYGIRTIDGGRLGFVTTNSQRPEMLQAAAREARDVARLSIPSEHHHVLTGVEPSPYEEICDPGLLALEPDEVYELLGHAVAEARRDDRVALDRVELTWRLDADVLANSAGVRSAFGSVSCDWSAMGMAKAEDDVTSFDYDGSHAWGREGLEDAIARSMGAFRESVVGSLGARGGETYRGTVLFHPYAVLDLLGSVVEANCNGMIHVDGISRWRDKVGETVASEFLTVYEDPRNRSLAGWRPVDREGKPTERHVLIDRGVLAFIGHNCFSAHRAGTETTGNAVGGSRSLPSVGFHNVTIEGVGNGGSVLSEDALFQALGSGLVVKRFSGNADPQSGHFSGTAKNSWWVRDGSRAHPVHETMIAGDLFELLRNVVAAGDVLHTAFGEGRAPYLLIDGVSVTAG
jgi:PmbA protein